MYSFKTQLNKLITLDKIRICKIFEMLQFSLIFLTILSIFVYLFNKYYYKDTKEKDELETEKDTKKRDAENRGILIEFFDVFTDSFLIILVVFYTKKIALLSPSIPSLFYDKFIPLTTLDYSIHIALVVVFIELLPKYKEKIYSLYLALKHEIF